MADETTVEGVENAPANPSDSVALTAEQRDEATIARLLGGGDEEGEATPDSEATATTAGEDDADATSTAEADDEGEDGADDEPDDVTDEELETILDALEDRILKSDRVQKKLDEQARSEADRRYEERRKAESVSQESERLIRQGRDAVKNVYDLFDKLDGNLKNAIKGEDIDESVKLDKDSLIKELGAFGAAAVAEASRESDTAFADAFREAAALGGEMTDDEKQKVITLVQTAQRIANDPEQGRSASRAYLFKENVKFLVSRAKEEGKREAVAEFAKKRDALKKVTGENGTKAAIAKLTSQRKKLPAAPPATPAQASESRATMEAYKAAKAAGDFQKADEIAAAMGVR